MRKIIIFLLVFVAATSFGQKTIVNGYRFGFAVVDDTTTYSNANGAQYYVDPRYGNDANAGTSSGAPWASLAKVMLTTLAHGDSVHFRTGRTFPGQLYVKQNGNSTNPIVYCSYGGLSKPKFTGFTTVSGWTDDLNGKQHASVSPATGLILVEIDGTLQHLGRYPNWDAANDGWLLNTGVSTGTPSISGVNSSATNWAGAEVAIRKTHWRIDRCAVTTHSGTTIAFTNPAGVDNLLKTGFGYFFQNDLRTLDEYGEWFYSSGTLNVFWGGASPGAHNVRVSTIDTLIDVAGHNDITITGLAFEGADDIAINARYGTRVSVLNCYFNNNYSNVSIRTEVSCKINGNVMTNTLNNPILISDNSSAYQEIKNNTITNWYRYAGMGGSGDNQGAGISQNGQNAIVEYNRLDSGGYNPIVLKGNTMACRYNYISNYNLVKDDGGGIYISSGTDINTNRSIYNNIIVGGIGARNGTPNQLTPGSTYDSHGVYADEHTNFTTIFGNIIADCLDGSGIFINKGNNLTIRTNIVSNTRIGFRIDRPGLNGSATDDSLVYNIIFASNIINPTVSNFLYWNGSLYDPATITMQSSMQSLFTRIDSNYYMDNVPSQFDWFYHTGLVATTAASGTGSVATVTFATQPFAPFVTGTSITVVGVTPTGYNGSPNVTGATTSTITYNSSTTGSQTVAGALSQFVDPAAQNFAAWRTTISGESHSNAMSTAAKLLVYNPLSTSAIIPLGAQYVDAKTGTPYNSYSITVPANSGQLLIYTGP